MIKSYRSKTTEWLIAANHFISDVVREVWPKFSENVPPANSTISKVLKKNLRMSYRVLKPAPEKILKPEYIRSYWKKV